MRVLGIIPARFASSRFPGKPLALIHGKTMIQRVYEQALKSTSLNRVIVATDDERILNHVLQFGGEAMMTSENHQSGTDRCHEVLNALKEEYDVIVNIQGDEPYIDPAQIEMVVRAFENPQTEISSLAKKITQSEELFSPNAVKVVVGDFHQALYFSRWPIPFLRGVEEQNYLLKGSFYKHIGLYAYRDQVLNSICSLPQATLEKAESLEQLRWLSAGFKIIMSYTQLETPAIDTPDDLLKLTNNN